MKYVGSPALPRGGNRLFRAERNGRCRPRAPRFLEPWTGIGRGKTRRVWDIPAPVDRDSRAGEFRDELQTESRELRANLITATNFGKIVRPRFQSELKPFRVPSALRGSFSVFLLFSPRFRGSIVETDSSIDTNIAS